MALLLPANGGTSVVVLTAAGSGYQVLGPIPEGRWVDLLYVTLWVDAATTVSMAWTMSASVEPGEAALRSGVPLIARSDATFRGIPAINLTFGVRELHTLVLAVGRRAGTGPSFIQTGVQSTASVNLTLVTSARILGLATETRERLGEPGEISFP